MIKKAKTEDESPLERFFSAVQQFLTQPPLIMWGSGATVPCGLPTMKDLALHIKNTVVPDLDADKSFEKELGDDKYDGVLNQIRLEIWNKVSEADTEIPAKILKGDDEHLNAIGYLIKTIYESHPQVVNFVTTNYDRVVEYVAAKNGFSVTDGTGMAALSSFDVAAFGDEKKVNVVKVHGSLSWFSDGGEVRSSYVKLPGQNPVIIIPGKRKYHDVMQVPYRELIQKTDDLISEAGAVLVVGFGFNDEHLTPKLVKRANRGIPIVVVTKMVTPECKHELERAAKMLMVEEDPDKPDSSLITYRNLPTCDTVSYAVEGTYWKLNKFMEALYENR